MKITEELLISNGYEKFHHPLKDNSENDFYQKKIDKGDNEYFIQVMNYLKGSQYEGWEFTATFYTKEGYAVQVATVQWFPKYCSNNLKTLDDVHNLMSKMYETIIECLG